MISTLATPTAQHVGCAEYVYAWFHRSSGLTESIASLIARFTMMPPSGRYPEVTPLAKDMRSGLTFQWDSANHFPVRQKHVITSSAMKSTLCRVHTSRTRGK